MDGSKQIGMQHYAMIMTSGQQTSLKLGNKFPIVTGSSSTGGNSTPDTQFTYLDVGMNFDATLTEMGENAVLKSSVEQASVAPQTSDIQGIKEPIIRQVTLRGEAFLTPGKTLKLGSMDIPGSTRHLDVEVVMEQLP
jgi:type II secretory pathway component GspD/PulD (secretin)